MSDCGRAAAYAAEDAAFGGTTLERDVDLDELRSIAATVTASEWWFRCGGPAVVVEPARGAAQSSSARRAGSGVLIRLAAGQRTAGTLTHELAHGLAGIAHGHDARFRAAHVDVVAMVAGAGAAGALVDAYRQLDAPAGRRTWPSPVLFTGPGFVVVP
jgi:hypothetical protein